MARSRNGEAGVWMNEASKSKERDLKNSNKEGKVGLSDLVCAG